jgi:hypothetical protein
MYLQWRLEGVKELFRIVCSMRYRPYPFSQGYIWILLTVLMAGSSAGNILKTKLPQKEELKKN